MGTGPNALGPVPIYNFKNIPTTQLFLSPCEAAFLCNKKISSHSIVAGDELYNILCFKLSEYSQFCRRGRVPTHRGLSPTSYSDNSNPNSSNCFTSTALGASVIKSEASFTFGNAITSLMLSSFAISMTMRSRP